MADCSGNMPLPTGVVLIFARPLFACGKYCRLRRPISEIGGGNQRAPWQAGTPSAIRVGQLGGAIID